MAQFGSYQNEIYGLGLRGVLPTVPVDYATLVKRATAAMPDHVLNYVQGGCGDVSVLDHYADAQRIVRSREPSALVVGWAAPGFAELLMDGFRCRGIGTVLSVDRQLADEVSRCPVDLGVSRVLEMPASSSRIVTAVVGAIDGYYPSQTAEVLGL